MCERNHSVRGGVRSPAGRLLFRIPALPILFIVLYFMLGTSTVHAETGSQEGNLALAPLLEKALEHNPGLNSLRQLEAAKRSVVPQVSSLPDPVVSYGLRNVGLDRITVGEEMMAGRTLSFSQKLPFPGKLGLEKNIALWDAEASSYRTEEGTLDVVANVKTAYYDLYYTYESIDIIDEIEGILRLFLHTAEARYKVGKGIQQDVLKAQVELSRLEEKRVLLEQKKAELKDRINRLVGNAPEAPLGRPVDVTLSTLSTTYVEISTMATEKSPTLKVQGALASRQEEDLRLAKREYYPDLFLGMSWMDRSVLEDVWEVRVGVEVPLYFWTKERRGVEEARSRYSKAQYDIEDVKLSLLQRVKDLYVELDTSERLYRLYEGTIVPQAKLALESSRQGYESGEVDFLSLFDNLITVLNYELEVKAQLVQHESTLAELESLIGGNLS